MGRGRLVKGALFSPEKFRVCLARQAVDAYLRGDYRTPHYLEKITGTHPVRTLGIWERAAEGFRRIDPSGERAFLLMAEMRGDYDPKTGILKKKTT